MSIHSKLKSGDMFGRYRLEKFLGAGGFAVVWKAYDTLTDTIVALKIFSILDDQSITDLAQEYAQVHTLLHPNIVRAEHFDAIDNIPYLVMKFCAGGNLENATGKLTEDAILTMMAQIASALSYLHTQGLVHQDIKPANILIEPTALGSQFMISDFGISAKSKSRLSKSASSINNSGQYITFAYAPPEKFSSVKADRNPNPKGDIFSLGITAYELATGHLPFDDLDTGRELCYHPDVSINFQEINNPLLIDIIKACLSYNFSDRPDADTIIKWIGNGRQRRFDTVRTNTPVYVKPLKIQVSKKHNGNHRVGIFLILSVIILSISGIIYILVNEPNFLMDIEKKVFKEGVSTFSNPTQKHKKVDETTISQKNDEHPNIKDVTIDSVETTVESAYEVTEKIDTLF